MRKDRVEVFKDSLFGYNDYRSFLKDYFALQKKIKSSFTQRYFAQKAGFATHTFCNFVINGKRNLSSTTLEKFIKALDLDGTKARYFQTLVGFNQTENQLEKEIYYSDMQKIKKLVKFTPVKKSQSEFFEKRYYAIVRELVVNANWEGSYEKLAKMVRPNITTTQAKDAVKMMVETGLLEQKGDIYSYTKENLDDTKVPVFLKKKARKEVFQEAVNSLDEMSPDIRYSVYTTFSADKETFVKVNKLFEEFRKEFNELIIDAKNRDEVYQMVFGNFPVSYKK